jgi:hypothetical protein
MAQLAGTRNISGLLQTSQQKAISMGLLTFALVVALLWGSFRPTLVTIIETSRKFEDKTLLLEKMKQQSANLTSLLRDQLEQKEKLLALDYYFPSDGDYSLFVTNLQPISSRYGFSMPSVSFSSSYFRQVEKISDLQFPEMTPVTFQVSLVGDPAKLGSYLSYIEQMPFQPKVLSVSYSPNKTDVAKTQISLTLLLYKMSASAVADE